MTARPLSLPGAEHGTPLLAFLVALAFAPLAAVSPRVAAYVVVGGLVLAVVLRSLLAGLALFIVLTFPEQLPGALGIGPTLAKPLGIVLVLSWLLLIAADRDHAIPFLPRDSPVLTSALLALVGWSLTSLIWASDRSLTLNGLSRLVQLVALVFVTYSAVRRARDLLVLAAALLVGGVVTSVYALASGTLSYGRLTGGIFNANTFAAELVVAIVVATFLLVSVRRAALRLILLASIMLFFAAFVETQSRSGLLALGAAAVAAVALGGPVRGRLTAVVLVASALGLMYYVYAAPPELRARVSSITSGASEASPQRADTWQIALRVTRDHPVLGVGLKNFPAVESHYVATNVNVLDVRILRRYELIVHNTYLEILAELGVVGLLLFLCVLAMTVGRSVVALVRRGRDYRPRILQRALTAGTIGVLTSQIFNSGEYSKQLWLLLAMVVGGAMLDTRRIPLRTQARAPRFGRFVQAPAA